MEERLRACPNIEAASDDLIWDAKQHGFSDRQLAHLWNSFEREIRRVRKERGIEAVFKCVDTCAAEFEAFTPYYYSTYERPAVTVADKETGTQRAEEKRRQGGSSSPLLPVSSSGAED